MIFQYEPVSPPGAMSKRLLLDLLNRVETAARLYEIPSPFPMRRVCPRRGSTEKVVLGVFRH